MKASKFKSSGVGKLTGTITAVAFMHNKEPLNSALQVRAFVLLVIM